MPRMAYSDPACKILFSQRRMVEDTLRGFVAPDWCDELDFPTLAQMNAEYIGPELYNRRGEGIARGASCAGEVFADAARRGEVAAAGGDGAGVGSETRRERDADVDGCAGDGAGRSIGTVPGRCGPRAGMVPGLRRQRCPAGTDAGVYGVVPGSAGDYTIPGGPMPDPRRKRAVRPSPIG